MTMQWQFIPNDDDMSVDPEFRLLVNGADVGISIQDARGYGGAYCVNREVGEGEEFAIHHHGEFRTIKTARAVGERVFRTGE